MKAFVYEQYGSPDRLMLKEIDRPAPRHGEVLVRVRAISLNPADWRLLRADPFFVRLAAGFLTPKNPVLGADIAGVVEAVGDGVSHFQPGDAVFGEITFGGFADFACASQDKFALKPPDISFEDAAAVPLAGNTALQAVRDFGRVRPGQKVLINGASGGVGTFAVQIAKYYGGAVTAVCSGRNVELVRSIGADEAIDYTQADFTLSGGAYDLILDIVGHRPLSDFRRVLAGDGRCALVGFSTLPHMFKWMIQGAWISRWGRQTIGLVNATIDQANFTFLGELLAEGHLKPVIDRQLPFADIPAGLAYLETGRARGKVVVTAG